ncbi:response regulator [Desulfovibrio aerotolerans]|uniref:histidine kinase n=1 Tax=Solidesulfovibrio aerotolerans TaxID=295255 RepID=A0A7C9MVE8_9BACT|nr:ATP-binding protein [Solidesulfovibrio aerotolerans]MYL83534.1 response regulator [Solidesulfovibrio aerotolerans]
MTRLGSLLTSTFLVLALLPLLALGGVLGVSLYHNQLASEYRQAQGLSVSVSLQVKEILTGIENDIRSINRYRDFFSASPEMQREWLLELLASLPAVHEITFAGPDGKQRLKVSNFKAYGLYIPENIAFRQEFREVMRSQGSAFGPVTIDADVGEPLMPLAIALSDPRTGEPRAVMLCMLRLGVFQDLVTKFSHPPDVEVLITGPSGRILAAPDFSLALAGRHFTAQDRPILAPDLNGESALSVATPVLLGEPVLSAVVVVAGEAVLRPFYQMLGVYALVLCGALFGATVLALAARRRIVAPIQALTRTALAIGRGEIGAKAPGGSFYETQRLAETFNDMTGKLLGTMHDLTAEIATRQKAQADLSNSQERLEMALAAVSDGLWDWRMDTGDVYFSPRWFAMLGYPPDAFAPRYETWRNLLHPEDLPQVEALILAHLETGEPYESELRMRTCDGTWKWIMTRGQVMEKDTAGRALRMLGTHTDITERKRAMEALRSATAAATAASHAKSEFLANMSHEIRTPLNGILGMLHLLQTTPLSPEQQEYLLQAVTASKRLTGLLSDILDISRIEAGKMAIAGEEFAVVDLRDAILELFRPAAQEKGLVLEFTISPDLPPRFIGDEARIRQILFNLVGNAIKFTDQGSVAVSLAPLPGAPAKPVRVLFTVTDSGIGVSDEQLKDIFEPFVQAEATFTRHHQGAGLGLSIVRKLVRLMDGELAIDNPPGGGLSLYLSLPLALPASPGAARQALRCPAPLALPGSDHVPLRILLAEDDAVSLMAGRKILEKAGYQVIVAANGWQAVERLAGHDIDLVLMDIQMPVMDGVEATRLIRNSTDLGCKADVPIVAMTACAMTGDKEKFLALGMDGYISKPVDLFTLQEVVACALGARATGRV